MLCSARKVYLSSMALRHSVGLLFYSFRFLSVISTSCSRRFCAFALIFFMEYDVVLSSMFVNFLTLVLNKNGSLFAIHSPGACEDCFLFSRVCSSVAFPLSVCKQANCLSSATSEEYVFTSIGVVRMCSSFLRPISSTNFSSGGGSQLLC